MANLDTENKRRSATGVLCVFTVPPMYDGTIAALDRMQVTYLYAGITPQAEGEPSYIYVPRGLMSGVYGVRRVQV